jgi:hypothetical protein
MKQQARATGEINVQVMYGIGGSCEGRFARDAIAGISTRELIGQVIELPQTAGPPARTANVLREVLRSSRDVDVEVGTSGTVAGEPATLDQVPLRDREDGAGRTAVDVGDLTIRISESYRGGLPCSSGWRDCAGR